MNKNIRRAVFLDFDGVLFDTVREVYAVAMISLGQADHIAGVNFRSEKFEKFNQFRYLIGPAWNYYYLMQSVSKKSAYTARDLESEFRKSIDQSALGEHRSFEENFFQTRERLRKTERDRWLSLVFSYRIVEDIRGLMSEFSNQFFLITTRDRESVSDLLNLYNLDIPEPNIFSKKEYELHVSKVNIIKNLINKYQIKESLFIDDLEEHLLACKVIENLSTIQAKWGYVAPEKKEDNTAFLLKELEKFIHGNNVWA